MIHATLVSKDGSNTPFKLRDARPRPLVLLPAIRRISMAAFEPSAIPLVPEWIEERRFELAGSEPLCPCECDYEAEYREK